MDLRNLKNLRSWSISRTFGLKTWLKRITSTKSCSNSTRLPIFGGQRKIHLRRLPPAPIEYVSGNSSHPHPSPSLLETPGLPAVISSAHARSKANGAVSSKGSTARALKMWVVILEEKKCTKQKWAINKPSQPLGGGGQNEFLAGYWWDFNHRVWWGKTTSEQQKFNVECVFVDRWVAIACAFVTVTVEKDQLGWFDLKCAYHKILDMTTWRSRVECCPWRLLRKLFKIWVHLQVVWFQ